jgi:ATP-binding cassette, subfamily B, bacterial
MLLATVYSVLNKLFDVLPEILIGMAVDVVVNQKTSLLGRWGITDPQEQLVWLAVITLVIWICESLFEFLYSVEWRNLAQNLQHRLRCQTYEQVQKLDMAWFEQQKTGHLLAVLNDDINQMERFFNGGINDLIQVVTGTLLVGGVFFVLTQQLAFLALLPIPVIIIGAFWFQRRLAGRYQQVRENAAQVNAQLANNLMGIATIKAYTAEGYEQKRISAASQNYLDANRRAIVLSSAITPVIRMAILAGFTLTLLYGGFLTLQGHLGVGSYAMLVFLTQRLLWPLTRLADMTDLYQRAMASIERVMNLLDTQVVTQYQGKPLAKKPLTQGISFQDVDFSYGDQPVLQGLSVDLQAGKTYAFVGATGSGKSTLAKLLLRFYSPQHGEIFWDGHKIADLALADVRASIGYVAQDTFLTDASVAENIAYGLPDTPQASIEAAAKAAGIHELIVSLPQSYQTPLGERGQRLSGGQRQRVALARAILKDPPVLILDEATSAVDNATEAAITASLTQILQGRLGIVIAHRLSTVRNVDQIFLLDQGRICEAGNHQTLLALNGQYAALWRLQTGETLA